RTGAASRSPPRFRESPSAAPGRDPRHRLSSRYVRMLFATGGTSFSQFVREERLTRARSMLVSPRFRDRRISDIAYEVGFNDLSYFNRSFRRRFGCSPGELRDDSTYERMRL